MILRSLLAALALLCAVPTAQAAFDFGDIICETTTTTGTGTVNLGGAVSNYATFASQITSASVVPYHIVASDGKIEVGYGVYTDAGTDTVSRVANWSTDGSGAELTLPAGTHNICVGPNTQMFNGFKGFQLYNDDAGAVGAILPLWHDSASAADGDIAGEIQIWGGADDELIGQIQMEVDDGATTSEDTQWQFFTRVAGADLQMLTLGPLAAARFFFGAADYPGLVVENTSAATGGPTITAIHDSASPADGDEIFSWNSYADNDAAASTLFGQMKVTASDVNDGTGEDGRIDLSVMIAGSSVTAMAIGPEVHLGTGIDIEFNGGTATTLARSADGELTLEGDAVKHAGRQMMWIPAGAMRSSAVNPASCGDLYDSGNQDVTITVCAFDTGATEENAEFGFGIPKSWDEGTITMIMVWTNAAGASTETVQFKIACTGFGDSDGINTAYPGDVTLADTWLAQHDLHLTAESGAITVQNAAENDYVNCRIGRDTSADNMTGDLLLIGAKIYWTDNASTLAE
jgi:hypothetical protein